MEVTSSTLATVRFQVNIIIVQIENIAIEPVSCLVRVHEDIKLTTVVYSSGVETVLIVIFEVGIIVQIIKVSDLHVAIMPLDLSREADRLEEKHLVRVRILVEDASFEITDAHINSVDDYLVYLGIGEIPLCMIFILGRVAFGHFRNLDRILTHHVKRRADVRDYDIVFVEDVV